MIAEIEQNLEAIRALCREYGVARLAVFGSATTDAFDLETSDVDLLVEFPPGYDYGLWMTRYFDFQERLSALLGRPVDLVTVGALRNPYFIRSVNASRQLLYAARRAQAPGGYPLMRRLGYQYQERELA